MGWGFFDIHLLITEGRFIHLCNGSSFSFCCLETKRLQFRQCLQMSTPELLRDFMGPKSYTKPLFTFRLPHLEICSPLGYHKPADLAMRRCRRGGLSNGEAVKNRKARRTKFWGFGLSHAGASHAPEKEAAKVREHLPKEWICWGMGLVWTERLEK